MLIFDFIILVWLKIVAGATLILFWLWLARDRGVHGITAMVNYVAVFLFWITPWLVFLWHQSELYAGHCGLRQGLHDCGLVEYLWSSLDWLRLGFLVDITLFIAIMMLMLRARVARSADPPLDLPEPQSGL